MKTVFVFFLCLISINTFAAEIKLHFSNGWIVEFEDANYRNYSYSGPGENVRLHHKYTLSSFTGATPPENRGPSVFVSGLFKHSVRKFVNRGDLSVIQFTMTSREYVDNKHLVIKQDRILFESKQKLFKDLQQINQALLFSLNRKNMFTAIQKTEYHSFPENSTLKKTPITLVSMSVDDKSQHREKGLFESLTDTFK